MKNQVTFKEKFIWNMLGSLSNAFSSLILSIMVNRILDGNSGGIFAFAYANAQLMLTIGGYEVRPYQSTDVKEKYSFNTYVSFRIITCILAMIITGIYILSNDFEKEKSIVIFFLVLFKLVEAFTDVYAGRYQQKDRIDLSGKLFFVRVTVSTIMFLLVMLVSKSLIMSSVAMFLTSFGLFWLYDYKYIFVEDKQTFKIELSKIPNLLIETFPLFIGAFIMMYVSNAPKYAINSMYTNDIQNIYNILFMPAFVINLFSIFIFRPMLVKMAVYWEESKLKKLWQIILFMYACIVGLTIIALIGTWILGVPLLSMLYSVNIQQYKNELMLVMFIGGISAIMTFANNVITIMRQQKFLLIGYCLVFLYAILFVNFIVDRYEIRGAVMSYGIAVGLLVGVFNIVILYASYKKYKNYK